MVFSTFLHSFTRSQPGRCRFQAEPRKGERVNIICRTSGAHASTTENPGLAPGATFCRRSAALIVCALRNILDSCVLREGVSKLVSAGFRTLRHYSVATR